MSIIALLSVPNPSYHPVNWEAALMLREDPDKYNRVVRAMVEAQVDHRQKEEERRERAHLMEERMTLNILLAAKNMARERNTAGVDQGRC